MIGTIRGLGPAFAGPDFVDPGSQWNSPRCIVRSSSLHGRDDESLRRSWSSFVDGLLIRMRLCLVGSD